MEQDVEENVPQPQDEQGTLNLPKEWRYDPKHLKKLIIGYPSHGIKIRASLREAMNHFAFVSYLESKNIIKAEKDPNWILVMQEELN